MKAQNIFSRATTSVLLLFVALVTQSACGSIKATHGQVVSQQQLSRLKVGVDTQDNIRYQLGSPSTTGTFNNQRWYYLTETTVSKPLNPNVLTGRRLIILEFDDKEVLSNILIKTEKDGKEVPFSSKMTPTQGQSMGVMEQMMDNVGVGF